MKKTLVISSNILFLILGFISFFAAMMSPFLFDAPGSENNRILILGFYFMLALPFSCFIAIIFSLYYLFKKKNLSKALWVFILPLSIFIVIIACFIGIDVFCKGLFSCPKN